MFKFMSASVTSSAIRSLYSKAKLDQLSLVHGIEMGWYKICVVKCPNAYGSFLPSEIGEIGW